MATEAREIDDGVELVLRPEVAAFAQSMERRLRDNDHKGGWESCRPHWLLGRACEEIIETIDEIEWPEPMIDMIKLVRHHLGIAKSLTTRFGQCGEWPTGTKELRGEAADVANFLMMIVDVCEKHP